jgi:hypothetical protein
MGRKSRAKRERREQADFVAALTATEGTWLEKPPTPDEQKRINNAGQVLKQHRRLAQELSADPEAANRFSIELFRQPIFAPLQFDDWLIESVLDKHGEPPVVESDDDPAFSNWLRAAVLDIASSRVRRAMAEQVRRFLPYFVDNSQYKEALAIDYNAYLTVMSDAVTPLLAQMMVGGLARWYEENEEEDETETVETTE